MSRESTVPDEGGARVWALHPKLEEDTRPVGELPVSRVLLMNDASFPWLVLVPRRVGATEIIDLQDADRAALMEEIAWSARALKRATACDKLNVAALGNVVPQLHVHVIARRKDDAAWPRPVWGATEPRPYARGEAERLVTALHSAGLLTRQLPTGPSPEK